MWTLTSDEKENSQNTVTICYVNNELTFTMSDIYLSGSTSESDAGRIKTEGTAYHSAISKSDRHF